MFYGAVEAKRRNRPYLVELMGMYEHWCLRQKWLRKRLARLWFQDSVLHKANCLHVNSAKEAEQLKSLGFKPPIAVIPVGVDLEMISAREAMIANDSPWPELNKQPFILYLSRLHPKKGLHLLIRSWQKVALHRPDWRLVIAGTGDQSYVDGCRDLASNLGIADKCYWTGQVTEIQKTWLYSHAHCYVLPTYSENFGNTVAEALCHKTPVITTQGTPWSDLPKYNCGWQVGTTQSELDQAIDEALHLSPATRQTMGNNGKALVRSRYSLESVSRSMLAVYKWTLEGGAKPECVV